MGNTPFRTEKMAVEMDEGIFFPMQVVNELRRQAAQKMEDAILGQYERSCPEIPEKKETGTTVRDPHARMLSVLVQTREQLAAAVQEEDAGRIYVESHLAADLFASGSGRAEIRALFEIRKAEWYLVFPHIFREQAERLYDRIWGDLEAFPWDGALVRNLESLSYLKKKSMEKQGSGGPSFVYIEQKSCRILEKRRDKWYNSIIRAEQPGDS